MKKIIGIFLCFAIMLVLCSCEENIKDLSAFADILNEFISQEKASEETISEKADSKNKSTSNKGKGKATSSEKVEAEDITNEEDLNSTSSNDIIYENSSSNMTNFESEKSEASFSKKSRVSSAVKHKDTVVSKKVNSSKEEKTNEELTKDTDGNDTETSKAVSSKDQGFFTYEGTFVNLINDNNMMYSIFKTPNVIVAYDTEKLEQVYSFPLSGRPAEIQVDGDNLLISFPDLKCIKTYNKKTFEQVDSITLKYEISSFCIDGNIIYHSEDDQHCKVYCTNLETKETKNIGTLFYFPKLLLNKEKGLLYIGESHSSGSVLYYYNTSDLSLHSTFKKNDYGLWNGKRTMFLVNDNIFWGGMRFGTDSAENVIGEYGGYSTYYADENFVSTPSGVYSTNTYQHMRETRSAYYVATANNKSLISVYRDTPGKVVVVPY